MKAWISVLCALAVSGCAAAAPGYTPPRANGKADVPGPLKAFQSGTVDQGGQYAVSDAERKLSCGKISGSMHVIMSRLKDTPNRPQESFSSKAAHTVAGPASAGAPPMTVSAEVVREKARLKAYNALLAEKKCPALDISAFN